MIDRERVIRDLTWLADLDSYPALIARDALTLLKEQEAELLFRNAKPITHTATKLDDATCPSCGNVVGEKQIWEGRKIFIQWKYCIFCGQKLDWESR